MLAGASTLAFSPGCYNQFKSLSQHLGNLFDVRQLSFQRWSYDDWEMEVAKRASNTNIAQVMRPTREGSARIYIHTAARDRDPTGESCKDLRSNWRRCRDEREGPVAVRPTRLRAAAPWFIPPSFHRTRMPHVGTRSPWIMENSRPPFQFFYLSPSHFAMSGGGGGGGGGLRGEMEWGSFSETSYSFLWRSMGLARSVILFYSLNMDPGVLARRWE